MYAGRGLYTLEINCTYPYKNKDKWSTQTHIKILKYLMSGIHNCFIYLKTFYGIFYAVQLLNAIGCLVVDILRTMATYTLLQSINLTLDICA